MKRALGTFIVSILALAAAADEPPVVKPIRYTWIASSCPTWNCAAAALVMANGDQNVVVLPTGREDTPWVVLKRTEEGATYIPDDEPYSCSVFANVAEAALEYQSLDTCRAPLLMNVPDGRVAVTSLRQCKAAKVRAVR